MTTTPAPIRAAIYVRISKDPAGLRAGVERQLADCQAEADGRGWSVAEVFEDNDVSAYFGKPRPAYERMLSAVQRREVGAVVVWAADRLHRSPKELERFIDVIEAAGAAVVTIKGGDVDLSTADGRLHARLLGSVARHESEKKSERIKAKFRQKAERGEPVNRRFRPFGFEADGVTVREAEAEAVRRIAADLIAGRTSLRAAARSVDMTPTGLRTVLIRPRTAGLTEHDGAFYPASWPAILDRDTWETVRALIDGQRTGVAVVRRHLLSGLAVCGSCGARLFVGQESRSKAPVYRCSAPGCPLKVTRRVERLEGYVTAELLKRLTLAGPEPTRAEAANQAALEDVRRLERRLEELEAALAEDEAPVASLSRAVRTVEAKLADARGRIVAVPVPDLTRWAVGPAEAGPFGADERTLMFEAVTGWQQRWNEADLDERRALLEQYVEAVVVGPAPKGRPKKDAAVEGVAIKWRPVD